MGFIEKKTLDTVFLVIKHGAICEEAKSAKDGFREITVINPKTNQQVTKFIREFTAVEGYVTDLLWYDTEKTYETRYLGYKLKMDVDGTPAVLDLPFKSRPYDIFVKLAENIDFNKPVKFSAWHDRKEDRTAFCAWQDDAVVRWAYTKENPHGCPPAVKDDVTGEWDFRAQRKWLKERMDNAIIPAIKLAQEKREAVKAEQAAQAAQATQQKAKTAAASNAPDQNDPWGEYSPPIEEPPDYNDIPF